MRTINRKNIEVLIIEEDDFKKFDLKFREPIGQYSVIEMDNIHLLRYVVQKISDKPKEYEVKLVLELNYNELDKLRNKGCL